MSINLEGLSAKELQALITQASQQKKKLAKRKPLAVVKKELAAVARKAGWSLAEIFGGEPRAAAAPRAAKATRKASSVKGSKVPPKYRHPAHADQTWAGRGQPPRWLSAELAQGRKLEDFLIR